ncbi:MAG: sugar phosphate isomerase/epimerase [Dysgonamonadaceae bacterium]|nr:sugar phosphate isomerase/epimerase [Dysgonamonadaceae bacterium]MDD4729120.1 sugar phosphate isomerase/epimerase [Dysgonamonadaceae bacterium]
MRKNKMTRREMLVVSGAALSVGRLNLFSTYASQKGHTLKDQDEDEIPFRICLNTSTIRGYKLPVDQQIDLCAEAGFDGVELWVDDVETYMSKGGTPESLNRQIKQNGLKLENMISFSTWIADDSVLQKKGVRKMRQDMELTARLGGSFIAAPAQGISHFDRLKLTDYAKRYCTILKEGAQVGVTPLIELWGGGVFNRLSDIVAIAIETKNSQASILLDFYHLFKGGNSFDSLYQLNGKTFPVFHINDYPAGITREKLKDADRVFPGDGICPFDKVIPILYQTGFRGAFSIELFNLAYSDSMDVKELLRKSYSSTYSIIKKSLI